MGNVLLISLILSFGAAGTAWCSGEGKIENIAIALMGDSIEVRFDLTGDSEALYVIRDVTVSEDCGKSFYSIKKEIRGELSKLKPGKNHKFMWGRKDKETPINPESLQVRILVYDLKSMVTGMMGSLKKPPMGKWGWTFLGITGAAGIYTFYARHKANELHDEYNNSVDPNRVPELRNKINRKDREFYISLGATSIGLALTYYFAYHHNRLASFGHSQSRKTIIEITALPPFTGLGIKRYF